MREFPDYPSALRHCVGDLIPRRHKYIVDILGEREAAAGKTKTVQVIAQHLVKDDGHPGLAIHLPFDPDQTEMAAWRRYLDAHFSGQFARVEIGPIGTTLICLDSDADKAIQLIDYLLTAVFRYPAGAEYYCVVHDEGPIAESQ